ncbi:MAG: hypothetical protein HYT76_02030 [Deltaproteobacteria bacterium]|nr:hypothetical protein [Deltaproteobacteria bacterium]
MLFAILLIGDLALSVGCSGKKGATETPAERDVGSTVGSGSEGSGGVGGKPANAAQKKNRFGESGFGESNFE